MENSPNILVIVGNDKLGRRLIARLDGRYPIHFAINPSNSVKRIRNLIFKWRALSMKALVNISFAELLRKDYKIEPKDIVRSNADILSLIKEQDISEVYIFRIGIIINRRLLSSGVDFYNVHCARLPDYRGLGQVYRIFEDRAFDQVATLHRVVEKIDAGEVIETRPYQMKKDLSYRENEEIAYQAGMDLLVSYIEKRLKMGLQQN